MRREQIPLIVAMAIGTLLITACEKKPQQQSPAPVTSQAVPPADRPAPQVAMGDRKEAAPPVQGQVDPKEPAQRRDFEPKK